MTLLVPQFIDQRIQLRVVHEALDPLVVDQADRGIGARTQALGLDQREAPVRRGLAEIDAQLLLQVFAGLVTLAQRGRQVQTPIFQVPTSSRLYML